MSRKIYAQLKNALFLDDPLCLWNPFLLFIFFILDSSISQVFSQNFPRKSVGKIQTWWGPRFCLYLVGRKKEIFSIWSSMILTLGPNISWLHFTDWKKSCQLEDVGGASSLYQGNMFGVFPCSSLRRGRRSCLLGFPRMLKKIRAVRSACSRTVKASKCFKKRNSPFIS